MRVFIFSEEHIPLNVLHASGATTRLMARVCEYLQNTQRINVLYFRIDPVGGTGSDDISVVTDAGKFIDDNGVNSYDIGIFIRFHFEESLTFAKAFRSAGGKTIAHLADPHIENEDPTMAFRVDLHRQMLSICDGVIATSAALAEVASQYNAHVTYIPDVIDLPYVAEPQPKIQDKIKNSSPIKIVTSGYPLHHRSFARAAEELSLFSRTTKIKIEFHIFTSPPRSSELATHGDFMHELTEKDYDHQSFHLRLWSPFSSVELGEFLLREADVYAIPGFSNNSLSSFQQQWFPKKGTIRIAQGIAAGLPVILTNSYPDSYSKFVHHNGVAFHGETMGMSFQQVTKLSTTTLRENLAAAQIALVAEQGVVVVSEKLFAFLKAIHN